MGLFGSTDSSPTQSVLSSAQRATAAASPSANRLRQPSRWRDPKLVGGIVLVALSVLMGSYVVAAADDRVKVWSASRDLAAGSELNADDLIAVPVALDAAGAYIGTDSDSLVGRRVTRNIGGGELIALGAIGVQSGADRRYITVPVEPMHGPLELAHGDRVDVYVTPRENSSSAKPGLSSLVLANVLIADVSIAEDSASGEIAVVLDVDARDAAVAVGASRSGVIDLIRVPVGASS